MSVRYASIMRRLLIQIPNDIKKVFKQYEKQAPCLSQRMMFKIRIKELWVYKL